MPYPIRNRTMAQMLRPGWSPFGLPRTDSEGGRHNGFDFYAPEGTPIYATGTGTVTGVYFSSGNLGWVTEITYPTYWTQDCHQPSRPPVGIFDSVTSRSVVGAVGHTGNAADVVWYADEGTLRHDHHVVWVGGVRVDPIAFYGGSSGSNSRPASDPAHPRTLARKKNPMIAYTLTDNYGRLGAKGLKRTYLIGAGYFEDTTGQESANRESQIANGYDFRDDGTPFIGASPDLTYGALYSKARAAGVKSPELDKYAAAAK